MVYCMLVSTTCTKSSFYKILCAAAGWTASIPLMFTCIVSSLQRHYSPSGRHKRNGGGSWGISLALFFLAVSIRSRNYLPEK